MTVTKTFKRSGLVVLAGIALLVLRSLLHLPEGFVVLGVVTLVFSAPVFAVSLVRHVLRGILWRVGSRLLVSYLLTGVLPLFLFAGLAFSVAALLAGQHAARRVEASLDSRLSRLPLAAERVLDGEASRPTAAAREKLLARLRHELGAGAGFVFVPPGGGAPAGVGPLGTLPVPTEELARRDGPFLAFAGEKPFVGTVRRDEAGLALAYIAVDQDLERELSEETGVTTTLGRGRVRKKDQPEQPGEKGGLTIETDKEKIRIGRLVEKEGEAKAPATSTASATPAPPPASPPAAPAGPAAPTAPGAAAGGGIFERKLIAWFLPLPLPVVDLATGAQEKQQTTAILVRTSLALEYRSLFGNAHFSPTAEEGPRAIAALILGILGGMTGATYLLAALVAGLLVLRIARATRRLSEGFHEIDRGNFAYRARLKGKDQLAGMVDGFNQMAEHLEASVAERAAREAVERELKIARDLQQRLLPSPDFAFPGVEIAVDFRPAAAIGGDFYHFLAEGDDRLTVVVADVSGHGLPTGIVMASAMASLSGLARSSVDAAALLAALDQEIGRTTDRRTFVTLAHVRFDLRERRAAFTNAGHLYPYRVTPSGEVLALENPARPLGLGLPAVFRTVTMPLGPGDLWVLLSDGVVEGLAKDGEPFGFARLEALLAQGAGRTAAELKDAVLAAWRAYTGHDEPEDDRTLVVVRVLPAPPPLPPAAAASAPSAPSGAPPRSG